MTRTSAYERLIDALKDHGSKVIATGRRAQAQAQCPVPGHGSGRGDQNPSLSITGMEGEALIYCHAGCDPSDIMGALGMTLADLYDNHKGQTYEYPDERYVYRLAGKKFSQKGNTKGDSLFRTQFPTGAVVYVTEGERDVQAIEAVGGAATCSPMGAGKAHRFDWSPLQGRDVIIVPDKDEPGRKHAEDIIEILEDVKASSVRVVEAKTGKDAADHIAAGHSLAEFVKASWWTPNEDILAGMRDGEWLDAQTFPPLRYAVPLIVPEGLSFLVGPPKIGKSWLVGQIGLGLAGGTTVLGAVKVDTRPVLYLALEDGGRRLQDRFRKILGKDVAIPKRMHYITKATPQQIIPMITAFLARYPGQQPVIFLDTFGKVKPPKRANQESYQADYEIASKLKDAIDAAPGASLVIVHHTRKDGSDDFIDSVSGTQAVAGAADCVLVLKRKRLTAEGILAVTGRDVPENEYAVKIGDDMIWRLDGMDLGAAADAARKKGEKAADAKLGEHALILIDYLNTRRSTTVEEATKYIAQLHDTQPSTDDYAKLRKAVEQTLRRLAESDRIIKLGRGLYRGHSSPEGSEGSEGFPGQGHESQKSGEGSGEGFATAGEGKPSDPSPEPSNPSQRHEYTHTPDQGNLQNLQNLHVPSDHEVKDSGTDSVKQPGQQTHSHSRCSVCDKELWAPESIERGYCEECRLSRSSPSTPRTA